MIKLGETNCRDCYYATKINTDTYRCRRKKYDVEKKTCFVPRKEDAIPKICKVEKNQRLVEHIMEFDSQGKEYDWYEQHIALIDGERKEKENDCY